jgi:hypothetical protein
MNGDKELEGLIAKIRRACRSEKLQQQCEEECRRRFYRVSKGPESQREHER